MTDIYEINSNEIIIDLFNRDCYAVITLAEIFLGLIWGPTSATSQFKNEQKSQNCVYHSQFLSSTSLIYKVSFPLRKIKQMSVLTNKAVQAVPNITLEQNI